jgi:hypothetical protein
MINGINIGHAKESVDAVSDAILKILGSGQEQLTIRTALNVLSHTLNISGTMVSNNVIKMTDDDHETD